MAELDNIRIGIDFVVNELPKNVEKVGTSIEGVLNRQKNSVQSTFSDLSKTISESANTILPDIQIGWTRVLEILFRFIRQNFDRIINFFVRQIKNTAIGFLIDRANEILGEVTDFLGKKIDEFISGQPTDLERLESLRQQIINARTQAGNDLFDANSPSEIEFFERRIELLDELLDKIKKLEDELRNGVLKAGIPDAPQTTEFTPVLPIPVPPPTIILEPQKVDFIAPLEEELQKILEPGNKALEQRSQIIPILDNATAMLNDTMSDAVNPFQAQVDQLRESREETTQLAEATVNTVDQFEKQNTTVGNLNPSLQSLATQNQNVANSQGQVNEIVEGAGDAFENGATGAMQFAEETQNASQTLDALGVFAADIAANINDAFSDLIFNGLKGNIDSLGDLWEDTLDTMLEALSQFAATVISNPIRIALEGALSGNFGGASGGGGSIFGGLGNSFGSLGSLFGIGEGAQQITGFTSGGLFKPPVPIIESVGFFGNLTNAIPAIGAIIAAVTTLVSVLLDVFKKTPRLDLDFDTFRDEAGKSLGVAAEVADFLDSDLFLGDIFNTSVSRKAGLGLRGGAGRAIQEAIEGQINAIQDIINTLPFELASQLNEALLNTPVDIESEVKGDRLLEFDETKDIAEKFQQFIEGDLQARFLFAIRDFFVGAFESLGVLGDAAQAFIDGEFEKFQGLSREERIEAGKEFLQDFQTLTDAFNVLNNNGADSIGATVNSIKNLSNSLEFDGVPSIEELDRGLEELINAAELDPDIIQDYLDLRNAILEAQRAILGSIQSIISSISSLNSIIVDGGGSAFDLTGFINQGLDSVTGLLGQDGLSVEDREELLGLGTGFLDQLIAEEQAAFQAQLEAAQQAAEAAAEAQRSAIRAQISGLEDEKQLIEENFDTRLEALEEELRIAEEFARLTESIQQTLNSIILGPDSVFTAVERLNIVQGDIASLQSELAATTDPSRQLELAGQLEDSLSTLFDLAGEAFGVNSPEFVAIFDQVTGGLTLED